MARYACHYFLALGSLFEHPDAQDYHIARYLRLVKLSYEQSKTRYAPVKMSNSELARFWKCNEPAARACLADMKRFKWIETRQVGRYEREIRLLAVWRNDEIDSAEGINAPSTSALHLAAQATAAPLPAQLASSARGSTVDHTPDNEGATVGSTLGVALNVVVVKDSDSNQGNIQQQQINPDRTGNEGATVVSTLENEGATVVSTLENEGATVVSTLDRIFELLDRLPIAEPNRSLVANLPHMNENYLLPWVHYSEDHPRLDGGYFVKRFKAGDLAPTSYCQKAEKREQRRVWKLKQEHEIAARQAAEDAEWAQCEPTEENAPSQHLQALAGVSSASEIWSTAQGELQLQMTRATFDSWIRPARALGWENGHDDSTPTLVVGVHSPYAKEWLENRLATVIQRAVVGIVGRAVEIRYVAPAEVRA
jgi:hypothetical protein